MFHGRTTTGRGTKGDVLRKCERAGSDGPIEFELKYRESPKTPLITYHLTIDEEARGPYVKV